MILTTTEVSLLVALIAGAVTLMTAHGKHLRKRGRHRAAICEEMALAMEREMDLATRRIRSPAAVAVPDTSDDLAWKVKAAIDCSSAIMEAWGRWSEVAGEAWERGPKTAAQIADWERRVRVEYEAMYETMRAEAGTHRARRLHRGD